MAPTYFPLRWESTGDQWWYASPIDWAAANGHYDLVRELLRLDSNHLIKLSSLRRIHRLEVVWDDEQQFDDVAKNRSKVAQKLLHELGDVKRGKNSLIGSGYGGWLLYTAASAGDFPFVQELLHKDPLLVFGEGEYGVTDILYAAARGKNTEVFRLIYDFAMCPRFMSGGEGKEVEENIGGVPSAYKKEMKNRGVHALARGGNLDLLKEFLGDSSDDQVLGFKDIQGSSILHTAAGRGQVEVVKYLVSTYEIVNSLDKQGNTALHIAACRGQISVVDDLIKASSSSVHSKNNAGETFLHTAVTGFQTPTFRRLDHQIYLMKQIVYSKSFNIQEIINDTDNEGRTALHLAIQGNIDSDLVELLMSVRYINVNKRDNHGMTPLDLLKQRPVSASSEILRRQLISAGAILSTQDYSARKIIASHLRKGSTGGSPGRTFSVADSEIFLYSGMETSPATDYGSPILTAQTTKSPTPSINKSSDKKKYKGIKRFLRWGRFKTRKTRNESAVQTINTKECPTPLRQRYSHSSSPANNKRTLATRSNLPSPTAKKKLASGMVNGVMQAMPHTNRRSRSNSFSRSSVSSYNSHTGVDMTGASCSNQMFDDAVANLSNKEPGVVYSRKSVNQYFCFGGSKLPMEPAGCDEMQPHEIYDRYVLSTA